ncbi:Sigma-54 dependent transcriptional regulatory protein [Herbaspirillum seropedicae]|nr:Sigma-54 dependent transcriptional regulatory protein [Herbaspirillum seropedicae]
MRHVARQRRCIDPVRACARFFHGGAAQDRPGLLRSAHKRLLFLDEIGELGLDEQAMLFKAIEEKRFLPIGADVEAESSCQLIAGTHRDLAREVAAGRFREDLFARIKLWSPFIASTGNFTAR